MLILELEIIVSRDRRCFQAQEDEALAIRRVNWRFAFLAFLLSITRSFGYPESPIFGRGNVINTSLRGHLGAAGLQRLRTVNAQVRVVAFRGKY
jgi:hypothetical protein